jgi:hypothetical protein
MKLNIKPENNSQYDHIASIYLNTCKSKNQGFTFHPSFLDLKTSLSPINNPLQNISKEPIFGTMINSPFKSKKSIGIFEEWDRHAQRDRINSNNFPHEDFQNTKNMFVESPYPPNKISIFQERPMTPNLLEPILNPNFSYVASQDRQSGFQNPTDNFFFRSPIPIQDNQQSEAKMSIFDNMSRSPFPSPANPRIKKMFSSKKKSKFMPSRKYEIDLIHTIAQNISLNSESFKGLQYSMFSNRKKSNKIVSYLLNKREHFDMKNLISNLFLNFITF